MGSSLYSTSVHICAVAYNTWRVGFGSWLPNDMTKPWKICGEQGSNRRADNPERGYFCIHIPLLAIGSLRGSTASQHLGVVLDYPPMGSLVCGHLRPKYSRVKKRLNRNAKWSQHSFNKWQQRNEYKPRQVRLYGRWHTAQICATVCASCQIDISPIVQ